MSSSELLEFTTSVRALLTKHAPSAALREAMDTDPGYDQQLWRMLCEQVGVAALAIPEEWGGAGATLVESLLVVEELGRTLAGVPMLGSAILGAQALLLSGDAEACARLLPDIAEGSVLATVCWADAAGWDTTGVRAEDGLLTGTAHYVLHGAEADLYLVLTDDGLYEAIADGGTVPGLTATTTPALDPTRRLATVTFDAVPARKLGTTDPAVLRQRLREIAWAAISAEQVGAARHCLESTVEYTASRVQFGRAIGSFQALKHRMADMYVLVESAESTVQAAAQSLSENSESAPEDVWVARVHCSDAVTTVTAETIQLHGGIAITWEHDAHLYFKRAHATTELFGHATRPR